jgi:DNA-binding MarR family transcriptional regulator
MNANNDNRSGHALNGEHPHVASADVDFSLVRNVESRLVRARAALLRELNQALSGVDLGANEANVLTAIGEGVAGSPTGLSEVLGVDLGFVSRLLNRVEKRSLLQRSRCGEDRRVVKVALTEGGAACTSASSRLCPAY